MIRCGGFGVCERFTEVEADTYEERIAEACTGCMTCDGRPPLVKDEGIAQRDAERMLSQVGQTVEDYRAGLVTSSELSLFEEQLVSFWMAVERDAEMFIQLKLSAFIDGFSEKSNAR